MSGTGFDMKEVRTNEPGHPAVYQAILFILPSIVVTVVSIILFSRLTGLTETQHNIFSITILAAIVLSLVGMAGMQLLINRMIDEHEYYADGAAARATRVGIIYSVIYSAIVSALVSPYFLLVLRFSLADFFYFAYLLFLYSAVWVIVSIFWASERYGYPAIIFTVSYLIIFALTLGAYEIDHTYTISGFAVGTTVLFAVFFLASAITFRKPASSHGLSKDFSGLTKLMSRNTAAVTFSIAYVVAIFLDKIIVWVYQGTISGVGLQVTGPYTEGAFLGLIPLFSVAVVAYFTRRTRSLTANRYNGTLVEIQKRIDQYKHTYWISLRALLLTALGLFILVGSLSLRFIPDSQVLSVLLNVSIGSIFFSVIIFNSVVLPIFGKAAISTVAVLAVVVFELLSIPLVAIDIWYCSLAFLVGSFVGFLISFLPTMSLYGSYEYNMYSFLLKA